MAKAGDSLDLRPLEVGASDKVPFKRRLAVPAVVVPVFEVLFVALPLWTAFGFAKLDSAALLRIVVPVLVGAILLWAAAMTTWLLPIRKAVAMHRRGDKVPRELATRAYRALLRLPLRVLLVRTALWTVSAAAIGAFLYKFRSWPPQRIVEIACLAAVHSFLLAAARAVWLAAILSGVRQRLFHAAAPLRRFGASYLRRLVLVALVVASGCLSAQAAFLYFFVPIRQAQYLQVQTYVPIALALGLIGWSLAARRLARGLGAYLAAAQGEGGEVTAASSAAGIYRQAQALPYRLAALSLAMWALIAIVGGLVARLHLGLPVDDATVMSSSILVVALGASIYESLWHRETMQPLLQHLAVRYRVPVRAIAPSLSLRSKLLLSFGGVVLLACGLALLWGFVQYKNLATESRSRQSDVGLAWLRSEIQAEAASHPERPTSALVREVFERIGARSPDSNWVLYFLDDGGELPSLKREDPEVFAVGGGPMGAPELPWYTGRLIGVEAGAPLTLAAAGLEGRSSRLVVGWRGSRFDLGAIAVLTPSYRGRGESVVRPVKELLFFFVALFGACAGIVVMTVSQFVGPIRRLEQRADAMARGELADPVTSTGEGDEVGRLTFALEEMRRALRDKLRSTTEINLDLERAVQTRTADLARKNKELAETLDKLTRAQAQLVRSEKMASIGQLVAGIAHEINNPVNAIVNTVGPLEESIAELDSTDASKRTEAAEGIRDMVRVVQRGAQRTKAIVQALHNYSRTDDEQVVDFDLNRNLDDSLELLRHLLKQNIKVVKNYGDVGRVRGHAGQIGQVFLNLLTNAAQAVAGRDDATITIETRRAGDLVHVEISDNGPGIPPEVLPRIWDPFFTTKDVGEGTGLGLSIVHELVERHGGAIEVETAVGVGTAFQVLLPRSAELTSRPRSP